MNQGPISDVLKVGTAGNTGMDKPGIVGTVLSGSEEVGRSIEYVQ